MRIVLDTNIFIPMEDSSQNISAELANISRLSSGKHELLIHPDSKDDLLRDRTESRKNAMISRLEKYNLLDKPPKLSRQSETELFGSPKKDNDRVDNLILYSIYKNCAHLLVTQDRGIHKKARTLGIDDRVLTLHDLEEALTKLEESNLVQLPTIKDVPCHSIKVDDPFFDSLKQGYEDFPIWFAECCKSGRRAWLSYDVDESINAICIYKIEQNPIVTIDSKALKGKVIKLCTFKVARKGLKIGELLLKQAFKYAIEAKANYVFITIDPSYHEDLRFLVSDFGFYKLGTDLKGRDSVYVKEFPATPPLSNLGALEYAVKYYPMLNISNSNAYIIPIQPKYHRVLFPEAQYQADMFDTVENSAGNAIKQAYLCKSPIKSIKPGDLIFFYRTGDYKAITTYGVVEQFHVERDPDKILQWVAKRTVYSHRDIVNMATTDVKVLLFRVVAHIKNGYSFDDMIEHKLINGSIQSITGIPEKSVTKIIKAGKINGSFVPN